MITLKTDEHNNMQRFQAEKDAEALVSTLRQKLWLCQGDDRYDVNLGIQWFDELLQEPVSVKEIQAQIVDTLCGHEEVISVEAQEAEYSQSNSTLTITNTVNTIYGRLTI